MTAISDTAMQIERVFEQVAERAGDITAQVFVRYFERSGSARELMNHMDEHMLGRMMEQVLLLMMDTSEAELGSYLKFETSAHTAYGVDLEMYDELMGAMIDVTAAVMGDDFDDAGRLALEARAAYLLDAIAATTNSASEATKQRVGK